MAETVLSQVYRPEARTSLGNVPVRLASPAGAAAALQTQFGKLEGQEAQRDERQAIRVHQITQEVETSRVMTEAQQQALKVTDPMLIESTYKNALGDKLDQVAAELTDPQSREFYEARVKNRGIAQALGREKYKLKLQGDQAIASTNTALQDLMERSWSGDIADVELAKSEAAQLLSDNVVAGWMSRESAGTTNAKFRQGADAAMIQRLITDEQWEQARTMLEIEGLTPDMAPSERARMLLAVKEGNSIDLMRQMGEQIARGTSEFVGVEGEEKLRIAVDADLMKWEHADRLRGELRAFSKAKGEAGQAAYLQSAFKADIYPTNHKEFPDQFSKYAAEITEHLGKEATAEQRLDYVLTRTGHVPQTYFDQALAVAASSQKQQSIYGMNLLHMMERGKNSTALAKRSEGNNTYKQYQYWKNLKWGKNPILHEGVRTPVLSDDEAHDRMLRIMDGSIEGGTAEWNYSHADMRELYLGEGKIEGTFNMAQDSLNSVTHPIRRFIPGWLPNPYSIERAPTSILNAISSRALLELADYSGGNEEIEWAAFQRASQWYVDNMGLQMSYATGKQEWQFNPIDKALPESLQGHENAVMRALRPDAALYMGTAVSNIAAASPKLFPEEHRNAWKQTLQEMGSDAVFVSGNWMPLAAKSRSELNPYGPSDVRVTWDDVPVFGRVVENFAERSGMTKEEGWVYVNKVLGLNLGETSWEPTPIGDSITGAGVNHELTGPELSWLMTADVGGKRVPIFQKGRRHTAVAPGRMRYRPTRPDFFTMPGQAKAMADHVNKEIAEKGAAEQRRQDMAQAYGRAALESSDRLDPTGVAPDGTTVQLGVAEQMEKIRKDPAFRAVTRGLLGGG